MSLFRFLKKGKASEDGELEAPPPPSLASDFKELPSFPEEVLPSFPESISLEKGPKKRQKEELVLPEFPSVELPPIPKTLTPIQPQEALKSFDVIFPQFSETAPTWKKSPLVLEGEELEQAVIKQEHRLVHMREELVLEKPLFIEGIHFRKILASLHQLRSMLQEGEEHLAHWNHIEETKDTHFERIRLNVEQLQRKFIYVDKVLFEGKIS